MCREDTKLNYIHTHTHLMFREGTKLNHTHTHTHTWTRAQMCRGV